MDDLKQRLLLRVEELRKQRAATAHRKISGGVAAKMPRVKDAPEKKKKKKKPKSEPEADADGSSSVGASANGTAVDAEA